MDYSTLIEKIMPLVKDGDTNLPFIISRNNGTWELDYLNLAPEKAADYLASMRDKDPCAVQFTGADFDGGSFSFVYDKVLVERLFAEYYEMQSMQVDKDEYYALVNLLDAHLSELSHNVTEFMTSRDTPLYEIYHLIPHNLKSEYEIYDSHKGQETIEFLEKMITALNKSYAKTDKLFHVEELNNKPPQKEKKTSMLGKLDNNKQKVDREKAEQKDKPVTKKPGDLEVD